MWVREFQTLTHCHYCDAPAWIWSWYNNKSDRKPQLRVEACGEVHADKYRNKVLQVMGENYKEK